jgi:type IV pilus assembly protein PilC
MVALAVAEYVVLFLIAAGIACLVVGVPYGLWALASVRVRRRRRERTVVGHLASVLAQDLPLAPGLLAAAASEPGPAGRRLAAIAKATVRGTPLAAALTDGFPECSGLTRSVVHAGERARQLPAALALAERTLIEREKHEMRIGRGAGLYMLLILSATVLILTMLMIVIVPKYEEIFMDFDTVMPPLTLLVIRWSRGFAGLAGLFPILLLAVPVIAYLRARPRRPEDPRWTSELADSVRWYLPGWHRLQSAEGLALAFRTMRLAVSAGVPMPDAARVAAELDINIHLRDRLRRFAERLCAGADAGEASRSCDLGKITAVALSAGSRSGDLAASLRYAADYHESLLSRWGVLLRQVAWPLGTLVLATFVAVVALAMFLPLIALIDTMTTL